MIGDIWIRVQTTRPMPTTGTIVLDGAGGAALEADPAATVDPGDLLATLTADSGHPGDTTRGPVGHLARLGPGHTAGQGPGHLGG